jgi:hypothetical protein
MMPVARSASAHDYSRIRVLTAPAELRAIKQTPAGDERRTTSKIAPLAAAVTAAGNAVGFNGGLGTPRSATPVLDQVW